jgi:ribosome-associated translation inhibitor RaiA
MEIETLLKIIELVSIVIVLTGLYWKMDNKLNLLSQKTDMKFEQVNNTINNNKAHSDDMTNRLIKSIDKLESTIERMNEKFNKIT